MIQLVFESTGQISPEWEHQEERLVFRLAPIRVHPGRLLHGRLREADAAVADEEAWGTVATHYDGDVARQVRITLELPDDIWDDLADRADALLEESAP